MEYMWIAVLLLAGLAFLLMEVFIPSAGLLLASGTAALIGSLVLAFRMSPAAGIVVLLLIAVLLPLELTFGVRLFPHTPLGKRMVLRPQDKTTAAERAPEGAMAAFLGKEGVTITSLRPAGVADIEGQRVDVVAEGHLIDASRPVKVVRVDGNRIVVRERRA